MVKTFPTLTIRWGLFAATVACFPSVLFADPIVVANRSAARGAVAITDGVQVLATSGFGSPPANTSGTFSFADSATANAGGATSTTTANIMTAISSTGFSAAGTVTGVTSQESAISSVVNSGIAAQFDFVLSEPQIYTYRGDFLLETEGEQTTLNLFNALTLVISSTESQSIFRDLFASTSSGVLVTPGSHFIERTGYLAPGQYTLNAGTASIIQVGTLTVPNQRQSRLGFDASFSLTPVPEPATLGLLTTGLVGLATNRRFRRRQV